VGIRSVDRRDSTLVLAPSFPVGGVDGDHLILRWQNDDTEYAVSLQAWKPVVEASATLRSVVESIRGRGLITRRRSCGR
jgi:hypothetical protein